MLEELFANLGFLRGVSFFTFATWGCFVLALLFVPSVLLQRRERPMAALAWILCLIELPLLGIALWWLFGLTHMRRRKKKHRRAMKQIETKLARRRERLAQAPSIEEAPSAQLPHDERDELDELERVVDFFDIEAGVFPSSSGNRVTAYVNGEEAFEAFAEAVRSAKESVHFEFYIWSSDETGRHFRDLLIECAERGVEVRALYDAIGGAKVHGEFMKPLHRAGGESAPFLPVNLLERRLRINFRNHRKIIVIDGRVAFTGGINLADEYARWQDTAYRFEGPVVHQFQEVFAEDWFFASGKDLIEERYFPEEVLEPKAGAEHTVVRLLASGPDSRASAIHKAFFIAITRARQRIWLMTPYFIPDEAIMMGLETAALRGIDVRIVVPGADASDVAVAHWAGRAFYERLLGAGVAIHEFSGKILHAKHLLIDRSWSFVGSSNMDIRSFRLNFETNCVVHDYRLNHQLAEYFLASLERSERIDFERFDGRPKRAKLLEATMRLFSPLL